MEGEDELVTGKTEVSRHQHHICQLLPNSEVFQLSPSVQGNHNADFYI